MSLAAVLQAPAKIAAAIKKASRATGADFDYLLKTAARESSFKAQAKARTSSAAGLFQFIESTWLKMVKDRGGQFGLEALAGEIVERPGGRLAVPDSHARKHILALRHDPELAAMMAGEFTRQNAAYLSGRLGREPTKGELYIAHFLGAPQGARLVRLAETRPELRADVYFGAAARANRAIFYDGSRPRSIAEVYGVLTGSFGKGPPTEVAETRAEPPPVNGTWPLGGKVAALPQTTLRVAAEAATGGGAGSVGVWQTIVLPGRGSEGEATGEDTRGSYGEADDARRSRRRRGQAPRETAGLRLLPGEARRPASAAASAAKRVVLDSASFSFFGDDYWQRMTRGS